MLRCYDYKSVFSEKLTEYIASRRKAGFMYDTPAYWLYRFDQFCCDTKVTDISVSKRLYDAWASEIPSETKTNQYNRLSALRNFCIYLNTLGIPSYIPKNLPKPETVVPYLMTDSDIKAFFDQVDRYDSFVPRSVFKRLAKEYKVLFRLVYCCGLRNSEACTLKTENVNLTDGTITIYHSKGNKDRLVYLSDDLRSLCAEYLDWLNRELEVKTEWFFPGKDPTSYILKTSIDRKFNEFWDATGLSASCDKKPTVHGLRHAYVIKRMNLWMDGDVPLSVMMPYLSSFLGHKGPLETHYYYHQVEDAFASIKRKDTVSARVIPEVHHES